MNPTKSPVAGRLRAALAGVRRFEPVTIPGVNLRAFMYVLGGEQVKTIEADTYADLGSRGLQPTELTALTYEAERARRTLARVVCASENPADMWGTLDEWGEMPDEWIADLWRQYEGLRESIDPIAVPLTDDERREIDGAIKKKDRRYLLCFGPRRLVDFMLTSAAPPSS